MAVSMLLKAVNVSQQLPFHWSWIDRPNEGQVFLIFIPGQGSFPNDGIRYQEAENRYSIPAGANTELEITESKYGFIPSHPSSPSPSPDTSAWRVRRRYRLIKGGHPQLVLVHYGRGVGARESCFCFAVRKGIIWSHTAFKLLNVMTTSPLLSFPHIQPFNSRMLILPTSYHSNTSHPTHTLIPTATDKRTSNIRRRR